MKDISNFDLYGFHNLYKGNLLVSYKGPMDEYVILSFGNYIKEFTGSCKTNQNSFFKVFMELIQNVAFYSVDYKLLTNGKKIGIGSLVIYENNDEYFMHIGNLVKTSDIDPIIEKCETINQMDRSTLREFKRKEIARPFSSSGGGNIGLIQVALSTNNPLNFELKKVDDIHSFFTVCVKIKCE